MPGARTILEQFYSAVQRRDMQEARRFLADDRVFVGPVEATTFVAEWHQVRNGKIIRAQSAFDGRPFAAMFAPPRDDRQR